MLKSSTKHVMVKEQQSPLFDLRMDSSSKDTIQYHGELLHRVVQEKCVMGLLLPLGLFFSLTNPAGTEPTKFVVVDLTKGL